MNISLTRLFGGLLLLCTISLLHPTTALSFGESNFVPERDINENVRLNKTEIAFSNANHFTSSTTAEAPAVEGVTLTLEDLSAQNGDQVCLGVSVDGFNSIIGMQFSINYDPDVLQFESVGGFNLDGLNAISFGTPANGTPDGVITMSWLDPELAGETLPNGAEIFEVCFTVTGTTNTEVMFSNSPATIEITNSDEEGEMVTTESGTVDLGNPDGGGNNNGPSNFTLSLEDFTNIDPGTQICMGVTATDFTEIIGMQFSINYDSDDLQFVSVGGFNLEQLTAASFGVPPSTSPGVITLSWLDQTLSGVTLADGTEIFEICFNVIGSDNTTVSFSGTPTAIEVTDADENTVDPVNTENGSVAVTGGSSSGGPSNFTLTLEDLSNVESGTQICMGVTVEDFTDIIGMQLSINYNPNALQFVSVGGFNLAQLTAASFGTPPSTSPGVITLSWLDQTLAGVTLADGTEIFEICFNVTGSGSTTVNFTSNPTSIEVTDGDENEVDPVNTESGTVTISGSGNGGPGDFTLTLEDFSNVESGSQICMGVSVSEFTDIIGMQFSINYDPNALQFVSVGGFNLDQLTAASFGTPPSTSPGVITLSWLDQTLAGVTLADGTEIFEICFNVTGSGTTTVSFSGTPTNIEVTDGDENEVDPVVTESGTVTISGTSGPGDFTLTLEDFNNVQSGSQICMGVSVSEFTDIIGMQFSINYDPNALQFVSVGGFNLDQLTAASFGVPPATNPGIITLSWLDQTLGGVTLPDDSEIFEICFNVVGSGSTTVSFSSNPTNIEVTDGDENEVNPVVTESGTVVINGEPPVEGFTLTLEDFYNVETGDQICMGLTVNDFENIIGMQFSINYDPNALQFVSIGALNLDQLTTASFGTPPQTAPGVITLSWLDQTLAGVTLPDGTQIFEICFEVIGTSTTTVTVTGSPTSIEVTDADENEVTPVNTQSGVVSFEGNTGGGDLTLNIASANIEVGEEVCLDVTVTNFTDIIGAQFTITYDPAVLQFESVGGLSLPGLSLGQFGLPTSNPPGPGVITLSWTDPNLTGVTLPDGTAIFHICFTGLSSGTSSVEFSNVPTPIEFTDVDEENVTPALNDGTVTVEGGVGFDGFGIIIEDTNAQTGDQICLDVTVQDFIDIIGMQFTINYDPAILQFVSIENLNLVNLVNTNFGIPGDTNIEEGTITLAWTDESLAGVTLPDGTAIFQICFEVIGEESTEITFGNSPTQIEITDSDEMSVEFNGNNGIITIGEMPPVVVTDNVIDVTCFGDADGGILITNVQSEGNVTYQWSTPNGFGNSATNLTAGMYTVTITDTSNDLFTVMTYTVGSPQELVLSVNNITNIACSGDNSGTITVSATGGTGALNYSWAGPAGFNPVPNQATQSNLGPGLYSVTVTDNRGCTDVAMNISVSNLNPPLTMQPLQVDNITNGNDGSINLTVTGGTGNGTYTYSWTGPGTFTASSQDLSGLDEPGEYCVTVTDAAGCTEENCVELGRDIVITLNTITNACFGQATGDIFVDVTGGAGTLQFEWRNSANMPVHSGVVGGNNEDLQNQPAGDYTIRVTDQNGQQVTGSFAIGSFMQINITGSITNSLNGNDGAIDVNVTNGSMPYTYVWDNGIGTVPGGDISGLAPATYCVTITDNNGCTAERCFIVPAAPLTAGAEPTSVSCNGDENGTVMITVEGGVPPYSAELSGFPPMTGNSSGEFLFTNVPPDVYTWNVTDSNGEAISNQQVTVGEPDELVASVTNLINDDDGAGGTGLIEVGVTGGTENYSYTINGSPVGNPMTNLMEGTYTIVVTDANGCTTTLPAVVIQMLTPMTLTGTDVDCLGDEDGAIDLTLAGAEPFNVTWTINGNVVGTSEDLTGVPAGTYTYTVVDATGATIQGTYTIGTNSNLSLTSLEVTSSFNNYDVSCSDAEDGRVLATAIDGQGTLTYEWEKDGELIQTGPSAQLSGASAGVYNLVVVDGVGCTVEGIVELTAPPSITLISEIDNISCFDEIDGSIEVAATGGAGDFIYYWSNDELGQDNSFLAAGSYTLTVTDRNDCELVQTFDLPNPDPIAVEILTEPATEGNPCNGSVRANVTGGSGTYLYRWLNIQGASTTENIVTELCPGEYLLRVEDSNGCQTTLEEFTGIVEDKRYPCLSERVVITPDGDGLNDEFIIFCIGELPDNHLEIYNRWGQLVFETDNYDNSWAGTSQNGERLPEGPYYFILEYTSPDGVIQERGSLTIITE